MMLKKGFATLVLLFMLFMTGSALASGSDGGYDYNLDYDFNNLDNYDYKIDLDALKTRYDGYDSDPFSDRAIYNELADQMASEDEFETLSTVMTWIGGIALVGGLAFAIKSSNEA